MAYIISVDALANLLKEKTVTIIDVRADLNDPEAGKNLYRESHIPGAFFLDLEKDLSGPVQKHGGNHPLPNIDEWMEKLRSIGVKNEQAVVIYDDGASMYAPRAWWLFHYIGHEKAYVLDGGYKAWLEANHPITDKLPKRRRSNFPSSLKHELTVSMDEVKGRGDDTILIDSRAWERYIGKEEPLYDKAGHIPGAHHYYWEDLFTDEGVWKEDNLLEAHFRNLNKDETVVVSCGSGVSACPNILALKMIGFKDVKLYPGSFSDWISYQENEVKTGEAP